MAFYYVKSGGTATGDAGRATTARTGTFAAMGVSAYYDNIIDAMAATTTPTNGDDVRVSSAHSHNYTSTSSIVGPTSGAALRLISVDDANADQFLSGAKETVTGGTNDLRYSGQVSFFGMDYEAVDNFEIFGTASNAYFEKTTITSPGDGDRVDVVGNDGSATLVDCTLALNNAGAAISGSADGSFFKMYGGQVTTTTGGVTLLFSTSLTARYLELVGVDLNAITGHILSFGSSATDITFLFFMRGCRLNASLTGFNAETIGSRNTRFLAVNCASDSDAAAYQYYQETFEGTVQDQDDTGIHRDESTAYPSGTKISLDVTTNANCSYGDPLWFDAPTRYAELSTASTDTLRIYFASTDTLTDTDVWAEVMNPDGTTKQLYNFYSNRNSDILAAGTEFTDDSGSSTWLDGVSAFVGNEYFMDIDTSSDVAADSVPIIRIYVAKASTTIFFDPSVDTVA